MQRRPRIENKAHLEFIRTMPCLITKTNTGVDPAHIRFTDYRVAKRNAGIGAKPDDFFVVPLCRAKHDEQHGMNEREFWRRHGIDPILSALALYAVSGNYERGCEIVMNAGLFDPVNILAAG